MSTVSVRWHRRLRRKVKAASVAVQIQQRLARSVTATACRFSRWSRTARPSGPAQVHDEANSIFAYLDFAQIAVAPLAIDDA